MKRKQNDKLLEEKRIEKLKEVWQARKDEKETHKDEAANSFDKWKFKKQCNDFVQKV